MPVVKVFLRSISTQSFTQGIRSGFEHGWTEWFAEVDAFFSNRGTNSKGVGVVGVFVSTAGDFS